MLSCGKERQGLLAAHSEHDHDVKDPALGMGLGTGLRRAGVRGEARVVAASAKVMVRKCMIEDVDEFKMIAIIVLKLMNCIGVFWSGFMCAFSQ